MSAEQKSNASRRRGISIPMIILGGFSLLPGLFGAWMIPGFLSLMAQSHGHLNDVEPRGLAVTVLLIATSAILLSLFLFGLVLRFAQGEWRHAASGILGCIALLVLAGTSLLIILDPSAQAGIAQVVMIWAGTGFLVASLPALLFAAKGLIKRTPAP